MNLGRSTILRLFGNFQNILKLTVVGIFILIIFPITFVASYIFVDYQEYLKFYNTSQAREIETLQKKTEAAVGDLKKLLRLAEVRIQAAHGKPKRLQGILTSLHHLQALQALPEFQRISYTKLSFPYMIVTRFGVLPLDHTKLAIMENSPMDREPLIKFGDKTVEGKAILLSLQGTLEGILVIEIDITAFKRFLGSYETINFVSPVQIKNARKISNFPIPIYSKMPDQYRVYAFTHKSHYAVFGLYTLLTAVFIGLYLCFLDRRLQKNYRSRFATLEEACFKIGNAEKALREELRAYQLETQVHQMTCQTYKKIQSHRRERQNEYANQILLSLGVLQKSFNNPHEQLRDAQQMDALCICLQEATALSQGLWQPIKKEAIDFKAILDDLQLLFAEKIHKAAISVEINIEPQMPPFLGDPLLMEALLINAIGKPLHRVPKNGAVSISLKKGLGFLHLKVQDNGFAGAEAAERLIRKPFELFMAEEAFYQTCLSSGLRYKSSKTNNGSNVIHLIMPILQKENLNSNVVQLFP